MDNFSVLLEPLRALLQQVGAYLPLLAIEAGVLVAGWLLANAVRLAVVKALRALNFHVLTERAGIDEFLQQGGTRKDTTDLFGAFAYLLVILASLIVASNSLGLQQVTELLERCRVLASEQSGCQTQEPCSETRIDDVELRGCACPASQRLAPGREPIHQEDRFEQLRVRVRCPFREPYRGHCVGDVEQLSGLPSESGEECWECLALSNVRQLGDIALERRCDVVVEPSAPRCWGEPRREWESAGSDPFDVLITARRGQRSGSRRVVGALEQSLDVALVGAGKLPLRQRVDRHSEQRDQRLRNSEIGGS